MHNAMPVLCGDGEHRLIRLFHSSAVLTDSFTIRRQNGSRRILNEYAGASAFVVSHAGIIPGNQASCLIGDGGFGIQVNEIQPCFAAPATRSCTLRTGYAIGAVDSRSLWSGDKLLKIFRMAAVERKYFSGASSITMSDNVQAPSLLGDSEIFAVKHTPFRMIPHFNKRGEDGFKCPAAVMR